MAIMVLEDFMCNQTEKHPTSNLLSTRKFVFNDQFVLY